MIPPRVVIRAPAKVNLRLCILARESSGFHSLESVFCALALADTLGVRATGEPGIRLTVRGGIETGPPENNLVRRAAAAFFEACDREPAVSLVLHKEIPAEAGLGGGSSDAAATLRGLNLLCGEPLPHRTLLELGARLGSDVPFFLGESPLALGWGRGQRLLSLPPLPPRPVLLVHPGCGIATPEAFRRLAGSLPDPAPPAELRLSALAAWEDVAPYAVNQFEDAAFSRLPNLRRVKQALLDTGAEVALLAGSGACLFGVYADSAARDRAAAAMERPEYTLFRTETAASWPRPRTAPRPRR